MTAELTMYTFDIDGDGDMLTFTLMDYPNKNQVCYHYSFEMYFNEESGYKGRLEGDYAQQLSTSKLLTMEDLEIKDDGTHISVFYAGEDIRSGS